MNKYSKHIIENFYQAFVGRTFDQDDVALFLAASRDYADKGSVLRELGDFIAHPNEKNRGLVIKSIEEIAPKFDDFLEDEYYNPEKAGMWENEPVFKGIDNREMIADLSAMFNRVGISLAPISEENDSFREFLACVIVMLEPCRLLVRGQSLAFQVRYGHSIRAYVDFESEGYLNHSVLLPVLVLHNVNITITSSYSYDVISNVIARRSKHFGLVAISYKNDLDKEFLTRSSYKAGEIWPLNPKH